MIHNIFFLFLFFVSAINADIRIESPKQHQFTSEPSIEFKATSSVDKGFFMVGGQLIPIRRQTKSHRIDLEFGRNSLDIHVFDDELKLQPNLSNKFFVYRYLPMAGVSLKQAELITDLVTDYFVPVVHGNDPQLDAPVLKRDLYAFLMWFFKHRDGDPVKHKYHDMGMHVSYMKLFEHYPTILPLPQLGYFYPDAYVTRESLINLLLLLNGSAEQISTSMIVTSKLDIPESLRPVLPAWNDPLVFVTRGEALDVFFKFFDDVEFKTPVMVKLNYPNAYEWSPNNFIAFKEKAQALKLRFLARVRTFRSNQIKERVVDLASVSSTKVQQPLVNRLSKSAVAVVRPGDSIQKIARRHYGDASKWKRLVELNQLSVQTVTINGKAVSAVHIEPGQKLQLD